MREVEVKILGVRCDDLEPKLLLLGAKKIFDGEIHALFFDDKTSSISKNNCVLRLRNEGEKTFLTYKRKISLTDAKVMDETQVQVSGFEYTKKILLSLGFKESGTMRKKRVSYTVCGVRFEFDKYLDDYSFIPEFLEIEADSIDEVLKYAGLLGFSKKDCRPWSGKEVIEHYTANRNF